MRYELSAEFVIGKGAGAGGSGAIVSTSLGGSSSPSPSLGAQLLGQPVGGSFRGHQGEPSVPIVMRGDTTPHHHHPTHVVPDIGHGPPPIHALGHRRPQPNQGAYTTLGANDYRLTKGSSSAAATPPVPSGNLGGFNVRGVKNLNPGNIGYGPWARAHGATGSAGRDTGHGVAVFPSPEAGIRALDALAAAKYSGGRRTANQLIAAKGGWTPGNRAAAANVARSMGLSPGEDLRLNDPVRLEALRRGLMQQELGPRGARHYQGLLGRPASGATPSVSLGGASPPALEAEKKP